ncbi:MAG TPA: DEAD/DEAH box helicase [Tepidisphaeraceae bacterium]|jgi:ATP-dependent RNA helicase RhlE|nr:DEAD/DEAH box helicase [Tepidisphaeraceae bacterium]
MRFEDLRLAEPIARAVAAEGYTTPTPIQAQAIPHVLTGGDLLGCAQTGTGKTAAFALPILHRLISGTSAGEHPVRSGVRCLVLAPTRELAVQIAESFRTYGKNTGLRYATVFGGVSQHSQVQNLRSGMDVVIATPGRLLDLINQRHIDLRHVEIFVLDEADRMLDMGFIADIRRIIPKLPPRRQNLLFSATMPQDIRELANTILRNPTTVQVAPVSAAAESIEQSVYFVDKNRKPHLLKHLLSHIATGRTLVFTRTKHGADRVARQLCKDGIRAEAIHGNKAQNARQRALANFKSDKPPVLVATDLASRGIDVDDIAHVVNYDLPNVPETYVHRIGRTGRAGATGEAVSFCDGEERSYLRAIERLTRRNIRVVTDNPMASGPLRESGHPREYGTSHEPAPSREHAPSRRSSRHEESRPAAQRSHASGHPRAAQHAPRREGTGSHRDGATSHPKAGGHRHAEAPKRQHAAPAHRDAGASHRQSGPAQHRPAAAAKHSSPAPQHRSAAPTHKPHAPAQQSAPRPVTTYGQRNVPARHPLYGASHAAARPAGKPASHAQPVGKGVIRHPKAMKPAGR